MRESAPLWTFQGGASPTALSISLDGKFAGVGHKSGLTLLNQNGRPIWNNNKIRRIKDISVSTRTGKMSIASAQKVIYLVKRTGEAIWHRELQSSAVSTSISSNGDLIVVGSSFLSNSAEAIKEITAPFQGLYSTYRLYELISE